MQYETLATSTTPALIIYVLDVSSSMSKPLGGKTRIDVVTDALTTALREMVFRSTKGTGIAPRYRIGMIAYSDRAYDLLDGIRDIGEVARMGEPKLRLLRSTDTERAFLQVEKLLRAELPRVQDCPAPLICHMTDGQYTGNDPQSVVKRIMEMKVLDGPVLVENIFISDQVLPQPVTNAQQWSGILPNTQLSSQYAKKLREMSSTLPNSYLQMMRESGYQMVDGSLMMLPGQTPELVQMGFVMSGATPIK